MSFSRFSRPSLWPRICGAALFLAALALAPARADEPTHVVQKGETLGVIATRHGTTARELQVLNDIRDPRALQIGQELKLPARDRPYTVRPGDALSKIAKDHGVTVQQLIEYNNLTEPDKLRAGQVLRIPLTKTTARVAPTLPVPLRRDLQRIKVNRRKWQYIVIHHSASKRGTSSDMDRYHRQERRMANGLAYHFVIGNGIGMADGQIDIGDRWRRQIKGGHVRSEAMNEKAIGICLVGNFDETRPTARQMESLEALTRYLMAEAGVVPARVRTHTQINNRPTRCPGRLFPTADFMKTLTR